MSLSEKVVDALRSTILLNERLVLLNGRLDKLNDVVRDLHDRITRLETREADIQNIYRRLAHLETLFNKTVQGNL